MNVRQVVPKDAIPSIDSPTFGTGYSGDRNDDVIVVDSMPAKAYPTRILNYHEIVNDVLERDGETVPIAVTWCPLCGSAIVYERTIDDEAVTFGVSGKLADDDLVIYDRKTGSEWKQSTGECIAGAFEGRHLTMRPGAMMTWGTFRDRYPEGVVLQPPENAQSEAASDDDTPAPVTYDDQPYTGYFESDGFGLAAHRGTDDMRSWDRTDLEPKTVVLGLEFDDEALGFPLPRVADSNSVVCETIAGTDVVVFATDDGIHAFEDPGYEFEPGTDGEFYADSTTWNGATGEAADGRQLIRLPARRLFAFAWQDDHGPDAFFQS
ncbi:DUF3179 domain-containing protein [Natronosalvus rutilus]|uniref:DUF3179 domain-containing protein n=1 Tax=Natronosalvus rutilus TaxID=2953753 RepID=A0A9E7ST78_9EURY|nr:DUF3179 domain-containing protein [Natronosalvus rutilus]UTF52255.1 DUF3179 domain-containing protein [Natronosalvus rutilus]